jgi:hypothetical protein
MPASAIGLLDSVRHKLRLARYHAKTLLDILAQNPHEGHDDPLRVPLEAHLEGLAYTGTAAAEKTIHAIGIRVITGDPPIQAMIRSAKEQPDQLGALAREFDTWWSGRQRGTRHAQTARDLRNDAAHQIYEKSEYESRWRMRVRNGRPVALDDFAAGYVIELDELERFVERVEKVLQPAGGTGADVARAGLSRSQPT